MVFPGQTSPDLELQGHMVDREALVQQPFDISRQRSGFCQGFPFRIDVGFEMQVPIINPPEVDMMDTANAGQCLQICL